MCAASSFSSLGFHFWISLPALVVDMGTLGRAEADFEAGSDVVTLAEDAEMLNIHSLPNLSPLNSPHFEFSLPVHPI